MSANLTIVRETPAAVQVGGGIDVANAGSALARSAEIITPGATVRVDLAKLGSADSVTLSVLLAWAARARQQRGRLIFTSIPLRLRAIAHLSQAEPLLGLAEAA